MQDLYQPDTTTQCEGCGQCSWELDEGVQSYVFLPAAMVKTQFVTATCRQCGVQLVVDGCEDGILRESKQVAFALEVMYQWSMKMMTDGIAWWTYWRDLLLKVEGAAVEDLRRAMINFRKVFQSATQNFISLQHIDYPSGSRCPYGARSVINDGVTVGFKRNKCCVFLPWMANASDAPQQAGSTFKQRVMIRVAATRDLLLKFSTKGQGMALHPNAIQ